MRPLKFRVWDIKTKEWVKFSVFNVQDGKLKPQLDREQIICQYTGLKDKFGKEIYEADVLRYPDDDSEEYDQFWPVEFIDGCFTANGSALWDYLNDEGTRLEHVEVVGNIYENEEWAS